MKSSLLSEEMRQELIDGAAALGVSLDEQAVGRFAVYLRELMDWNQKYNLTAIREPSEIITRHFLDALTCVAGYDFQGGRPVIDVGSGAGLPGVALKIAFPDLPLSLLDSSVKKVEFLNHLCGALGFTEVDVAHGRAEEFGHVGTYRQRFHLALSRGVAPLPVLAELCLPFVSVGGYFLAQKNLDLGEELELGKKAIPALGGGEPQIIEVRSPGAPIPRALIQVRKEAPTPYAYPRRPGVPAKRPLGSPGAQRTHPKYQ